MEGRQHFQDQLAALETSALGGIDLVVEQLDRTMEALEHQDVELASFVIADDDRIDGRYAGPNTKLGISIVAVWHITDHYGQLVEYLRMNRLVPPFTQKYGVKVR